MPSVIALDAMGSDRAPKPEVEGAIQAARHYDVRVLLVGRREAVEPELARHPSAAALNLEIVHASEAITMEEAAAKSFRRKRDSSIRVAARLVREGHADGLISAGNTGAVMATVKIVLGVLAGVDRPALAAVFPTSKGRAVVTGAPDERPSLRCARVLRRNGRSRVQEDLPGAAGDGETRAP